MPQPTVRGMDQPRVEDRKLRFVRHLLSMRVLGNGLAGLCVASVLWTNGSPAWLWALLAFEVIARPHLSAAWARRSQDPSAAEFRNLQFDAASGGFWIAAMSFNLLPSVLLLSMLGIGEAATGGRAFFLRCLAIQAAVAAVASVVFRFGFAPTTSMPVLIACVPYLVVYPVTLSLLLHGLNGKVRRQKRLLERIVSTDGLTGLANRQHWEWAAERELEAAREDCTPAAMLMIDIDDFKHVNDRYGHIRGDEVVTTVAQTLRAAILERHVAGRYAGDELAVVMPGTDEHEAHAVAEAFRRDVARLRFPGAPTLRCTVSVGVARLARERDSLKDWIDAADQAMYHSKRGGRNRVTLAPRIAETPGAAPVALLPRRAV